MLLFYRPPLIHLATYQFTTDYSDDTDMENSIHEALSENILGAEMAILNELTPGPDEKLYENALLIELLECGAAACPAPH